MQQMGGGGGGEEKKKTKVDFAGGRRGILRENRHKRELISAQNT